MSEQDAGRPLPLAVIVQPDPMLGERPIGPLRIAVTMLAATAVVALVMYGLSRPQEPQQTAAAPETPPAANAQQPATTGSGQQTTPAPAQPPQAKPAARSDSVATGRGNAPNDKPAPPAK